MWCIGSGFSFLSFFATNLASVLYIHMYFHVHVHGHVAYSDTLRKDKASHHNTTARGEHIEEDTVRFEVSVNDVLSVKIAERRRERNVCHKVTPEIHVHVGTCRYRYMYMYMYRTATDCPRTLHGNPGHDSKSRPLTHSTPWAVCLATSII